MKLLGTAFLLMLLSIATNAARTSQNSNKCSMQCSNQEDPLFQAGQTYTYAYKGESNINTVNGLYESTGLLIKSKVTITGLSNCEMKLSMSDVQVMDKTDKEGTTYQESPNNEKVKQVLEQNEVFFTRENQKVKSICMDKDEPVWSENIKKVLIDTLANQGAQTKIGFFHSTSHGKCLIESEPFNLSKGSPKPYSFQYNLKKCKNKKMTESIFTDLTRAAGFDVSQVSCEYHYEENYYLQSVQCKEEYKMTPFKQKGNKIGVEIKTSLIKTSQSKSTDQKFTNKNVVETEIEQTQEEIQQEESTFSSVRKTLKDICEQQESLVTSSIPKLFMKLINQLKYLNSKEFKEIYFDVMKSDICTKQPEKLKSLFYDAVGFVNSPASTLVMIDLIKSNHISLFDQNVWFTSLSFMQQTPTIDMIKELGSLISTENPTTPMYLGISAVTHLYCKHNSKSCLSDPIIKTIISKFLKNLNTDCSYGKNDDQFSKVLISLKALENLKVYNNEVMTVLTKCVSTNTNSVSIRVSALEVMKHMDCDKDRKAAMDILQNNENDSELRINAYLAVMGCANIDTLFKVREILEKEKVNQVGSFIWTHLTNIKESRDILKKDIQELLNDVELKKVFDISKLKFSRNIEKTFKTNQFGMTFDSNIIFSEKSFIPRSISLNTTANILGRPSNFIEVSARLEGLEELLFKLYGPKKDVTKESTVKENLMLINMLNEMSGNLNIKLYGQQISLVQLVQGSFHSLKKYNILEELMSWDQDKSFEINKNLQIIDKTAVIPTMLGFPLQFKLQGSVAVDITFKSKLDVSGLFRWPVTFNIDNHISPNINAEFNADIVLQAPFSKYGMRLNLKSGTNTELKATIQAGKDKEFSIKFDTPKTKQDFISIEGNTYVLYRNEKIIQLKDKMSQHELCSTEITNRILGVKVCGEVRYLDSMYRKDALITGPFFVNIYIKKEDTQTGYILKAFSKSVPVLSETGQSLTNRFIKFEFDTPNSKLYNRRFYGELSIDFKEKYFKAEVTTPWTQAMFLTTFKLSENEKKIGIKIQANKQDIVDVMIEHLRFSTSKGYTVKGGINVSVLKLSQIKTKWSLESTKQQWVYNLLSKGLFKDDTQLKLKIVKIQSTRELSIFNKYQVSGFYNSFFGNGKISGIASENYYGHRWDVKLNHKPKDKSSNEFMVIFRHKTEDKSSKNLNKYFLTTTLAYGKKAENFLRLKTENELSDKHLRTTLKASYGENDDKKTKSIQEIDLQLYGGFTWKEDNKHYAEGSLSFKFPTKQLNYEGRFNSEIGKRMFKMSLAFDADQQSKINLKVNYIQPKLYLRNTNLDITFSLPNRNMDVKWNLMEVDVNKFKYSLEGKYNNYNVRVDGVQTQISTLDHDSVISVYLPRIDGIPKQINVNLRINLVDLANSVISAKIEIPNIKYRYSVDTKFSFIPQNLLQIPANSEVNSVLKYDLDIVGSERILTSKFIFICNPEEFRTFFNWNMNSDKNSDNQLEFDIHALHRNPSYRRFNNVARITISYPGNSHSLGFKSDFKYTEMLAQIDFTWNRDQRISINTMYEIDNSWTQKGLTGSLTIKTPFRGYEQTHFGINAVGQLRYRKVDFEMKWGSNKKLFFDIIIEPKSSSDFTLSSKLMTPFKGMNLMMFQVKHIHTSNSLNTQGTLEIGPKKKYHIKLEAMNNNDGKNRDISASLQIDGDFYPSFRMSVGHNDDSTHFKSSLEAVWMKTESFNVKSDISYTLEDYELITKGNVDIHTNFKSAKQMKATWTIENRNGQFSVDLNLLNNLKNFLKSSIKGFYEADPNFFKMDINGVATTWNDMTMRLAGNLKYVNINDLQHQFSIGREVISIYSHKLVVEKRSLSFKVLMPDSDFKTIELFLSTKQQENVRKSLIFLKLGDRFVFKFDDRYILNVVSSKKYEMEIKQSYYTDIYKLKELNHDAKFVSQQDTWKIESKTTLNSVSIINFSLEAEVKLFIQKLKIALSTKNRDLKNLYLEIENQIKESDGTTKNSFELKLNDNLKVASKITYKGFESIDVDLSFKYVRLSRFLKFKHNINLMDYQHSLDTNIFGKVIKFQSSTEYRGGFAIQSKLQGDFYFMKSLDVFGRFNKEGHFEVFYELSRNSGDNDKIKVAYSNINDKDIKSNDKEGRQITLEIKTRMNKELKFQFNYEGSPNSWKHSNDLMLSIGEQKFEMKNKLEKVKWKYLLIKSEVKSNYDPTWNYKIGIEYNLKPSQFLMDLKVFLNEKFVRLSTKFESNAERKVDLMVETSYMALKEIRYVLKQKQNALLTQVRHQCKLVVKSYETTLNIENDIEWSGLNYLKIEASVSGESSKNSYLIQPRSLKIVHELHNNLLKEELQISYSKDSNLKLQLRVPLQRKSNSIFEFESSFKKLKQLNIEFNINFSEKETKSVALKVQKNNVKYVVWESNYRNQKELFLISTDLEVSDIFKNRLEVEVTKTSFGTNIFKGKASGSYLKEPIVLVLKLEIPKQQVIASMTGVTDEQIAFYTEFNNERLILKVNYGQNIFHLHTALNTKEEKYQIKSTFIINKIVNTDFEIFLTPRSIKLSGKFEKHRFEFILKKWENLKINFNILKTSMDVVMKLDTKGNVKTFIVVGKSNLNDWKTFKNEWEIIDKSPEFRLKTSFLRETKEIMKVDFENQFGKQSKLKYSSVFEAIKSGDLDFNYEGFPNKLDLKFTGESWGKKFAELTYNKNSNSFSGQLKSSFEWIQNIKWNGKLIKENEETKGSFKIEHNNLRQPIDGQLLIKGDTWKFDIKTPFPQPYNKLSLKQESSKDKFIIEITDTQNKLFIFKSIQSSNLKRDLSMEVMTPKEFYDFTFSMNYDISLEDPNINIFKLKVKSIFFEESRIELTSDKRKMEWNVRFFHPSKEGELKLSSSESELGRKVEILSQYGDIKHGAEFIYKFESLSNVYLKLNLKSSSLVDSSTSFEMNYKHKLIIPNMFNLEFQGKFNDKTVLYKSISWNRQSDNSFHFLGKLTLTPSEKEYENKIDISSTAGKKFGLIISLAEVLQEDINIQMIFREENLEFSIKSPFELIKTVKMNVKLEKSIRTWLHTISLETNLLGKYELISELTFISNTDFQMTSQLNIPSTTKKVFTKVNIRNVENDQSLNGLLELDEKVYEINLARQQSLIKMKVTTPFEYLKRFEFIMKEQSDVYETEVFYNDHQMKLICSLDKKSVSLNLQSNTKFFKDMAVSIQKTQIDEFERSVTIKANKDEKVFKISFDTNSKLNTYKFSSENELINFLPKSSYGIIRSSFSPVDFEIEIKTKDISRFKIVINKDQFFFNNQYGVPFYKSSVKETKINLTREKLEVILLANKVFSITITRTSEKQVDASLMLNGNQYSLRSVFENTDDRFNFKLSTFKNVLEKIVEINSEIEKRDKWLEFEVIYFTKTIMKLKLVNENSPARKLSLEVRLLSFNGVADFYLIRKEQMKNLKISWNFLYNNEQLQLGSVELVSKSSRPLNYAMNINLRSAAFQVQLLESDNGEFRFIIASPFEGFDVDLKWFYDRKSNNDEFWVYLGNSIIGQYNAKLTANSNKDPEIKFVLSSTEPIFRFKMNLMTSTENQYSLNMELRMFDWEKIEINGKVSTKDFIELIASVNTPFKAIKHIRVEKTIRYVAIFEQQYETKIIYDGVMKLKYSGGHEINWSKKIFKVKGSFHNDEMKIVSVDLDHAGNHEQLDHSFIWHIKDQKFGYKLQGKLNPMFEGKTEIYTPFHKTGNLVLMGKQMESGVLIEGGKDDGSVASFEYMKTKDMSSIKVTPPTSYGKPLAVKYQIKRYKRSTGVETNSEATYGTDKFMELSTKLIMDKDKYSAKVSFAAPKFTTKSAELHLNHNYEDKKWNFDHQFKVKDSMERVYRVFGSLFKENMRNFKLSLNMEHPDFGLNLMSLSHSLGSNEYDHEFLIKSGDETVVMQTGNFKYDSDKSSFNGEIKSGLNNRQHKIKFHHSGNWKRFLQTLYMEYNDNPYFTYKAQVDPQDKSVIEIELPNLYSTTLKAVINRKENKVDFSCKTSDNSYSYTLINKDGILETIYKFNDKNVASLSIGYGTRVIFMKGTYLEYKVGTEMTLENSILIIKMRSNWQKVSQTTLKISKNTFMAEVKYMGKLYSLSAEYGYLPENVFLTVETTIIPISKFGFYLTPKKLRVLVDEYFLIIEYMFNGNHVQISGDNNLLPLKTVFLEWRLENNKKAILKIEMNTFKSESNIEFSTEKINAKIENNYFSLSSLELDMFKKVEKNFKHWILVVTANKIQLYKVQFEIKDLHYFVGVELYSGLRFVASYNEPKKETTISLSQKDKYIHIIQRIQDVSSNKVQSMIIETSLDSSLIIQKIKNTFTYSMSDSRYYFKSETIFNKINNVIIGDISKSKLHLSVLNNNSLYSVMMTGDSINNPRLEVVFPDHHLIMKHTADDNQYTCTIQHNKRMVLKMIIQQNLKVKSSIAHESTVYFYEKKVWDLNFKTNFKTYEIKMSVPVTVEVTIKNHWRKIEKSTVGFLVKYFENNKPVEIGATLKFLLTNQKRSFDIQIENNFHLLNWRQRIDTTGAKETEVSMMNKQSKDQWEVKVKYFKTEAFELYLKTPTNKKEIKYSRKIENNVSTLTNLEVFGILKYNLKSNKVSPDTWTGSLSLYSVKVATVDVGKDYIKAIINDKGSEDERIYFKYSTSSQGEWKKNFISKTQLTVIQKSLNINVDILKKVRMESTMRSQSLTIKYETFGGVMKTLKLGASLDFTEPHQIVFELENPIVPFKTVLSRSQPNKSTLRYNMETIFNENDRINGFFEMKTDSNIGVTARLYYNPKDESEYLQLHSKYLDDHQMETHIFIQSKQTKTTYFQILLRLLNENNIETTFAMQYDIMTNLNKYFSQIVGNVRNEVHDFLVVRSKWMKKERSDRYNQIAKILPKGGELRTKLERFFVSFIEYSGFWKEMYELSKRDEFYLKSSTKMLFRTVLKVKAVIADFFPNLARSVDNFYRKSLTMMKCLIKGILSLKEKFNVLAFILTEMIFDPIQRLGNHIFIKYFSNFQEYFISIFERVQVTFTCIFREAISISTRIKKLSDFVILNQTYKIVKLSLDFIGFTVGKLMEGSLEFLKDEKQIKLFYNNWIKALENLSEKLSKKIHLLRVDENFSFLMEVEYFQQIENVFSTISQYLIEQLKDETNQKAVRDFVLTSLSEPFNEIKDKFQAFTLNLIWPSYAVMDFNKDQRLNDKKEFKSIITYTIPVPMKDFKSLPDFNYVTHKIRKLRLAIMHLNYLPKIIVSSFSKYLAMKDWFIPHFPTNWFPSVLPEFESYATISKTTVVTFDKKIIQLNPDTCKILLSKDNQFKRWEIILNQQNSERIYTINIGDNTLEISGTDYKVKLNGKPSELPINFGSTSLVGLGRMMKLKDSLFDLTITIDPMNEIFTVGISGWYHGKVRGLFGNFDNEPFNDLMLDDGKIVESDVFTKAYKYNEQACKIQRDKPQEKVNYVKSGKKCPFMRRLVCKFLYMFPFSPLGGCFKTVDPSQFYKICTNSEESVSPKLDTEACASARQYQSQCSQAGVNIPVPYPCKKCGLENGEVLSPNDAKSIKHKDKVSDIILIVDEGQCINSLKNPLQNLISSLETEMNSKGMSSVRFGLLTFVNKDHLEANFHTVGQKLLGSSNEMIKSLERLEYETGQYKDIEGAISLASSYPFREHASRHILMISCQQTNYLSRSIKTFSDRLKEKAIQFSLLTDITFKLKDDRIKNVIFGVDSKNVYTSLSRNGNANSISKPKTDFLYKLALQMNGVVFDYKFLTSHQETIRRRFISTLVNQISSRATPARSAKCVCVDDGEFNCVPLDTHTIFPIKKLV